MGVRVGVDECSQVSVMRPTVTVQVCAAWGHFFTVIQHKYFRKSVTKYSPLAHTNISFKSLNKTNHTR